MSPSLDVAGEWEDGLPCPSLPSPCGEAFTCLTLLSPSLHFRRPFEAAHLQEEAGRNLFFQEEEESLGLPRGPSASCLRPLPSVPSWSPEPLPLPSPCLYPYTQGEHTWEAIGPWSNLHFCALPTLPTFDLGPPPAAWEAAWGEEVSPWFIYLPCPTHKFTPFPPSAPFLGMGHFPGVPFPTLSPNSVSCLNRQEGGLLEILPTPHSPC